MITPAYVRIMRRVFFKGGGGDSYDVAYNARMATIAETQQGMANEYFQYWQESYRPMEEEQISANRELLPHETAFRAEQIHHGQELLPHETEARKKEIALTNAQGQAAMRLLPQQTALTERQIGDSMVHIAERAPVRSEFYNQALNGVDAESWASKAAADATQAFMGSQASMTRSAARMGVNPESGRFAGMQNSVAMDRAKAIGGAKTTARTAAEGESFNRLNTAMGYGG
jgi:hypothetical protein